jgi:hypothetical protein
MGPNWEEREPDQYIVHKDFVARCNNPVTDLERSPMVHSARP